MKVCTHAAAAAECVAPLRAHSAACMDSQRGPGVSMWVFTVRVGVSEVLLRMGGSNNS